MSYSKRNRLGERLGSLAYEKLRIRQQEAGENIRIAFPEAPPSFHQKILRGLHRHFGIMFLDALCGEAIVKDGRVAIEGKSKLNTAFQDNKGVILISGHFGNWELIPIWLAINGYEIVTVVQRQSNRGADLFFREFRQKVGTSPVYQSTPVTELIRYLKDGKILILASDQNAGEKGEFIDFFGRPASSPRGANVLHKKTGASIITALCHKENNENYILKFDKLPEYRQVSIMTRFTSILENEIRNRPSQYFWFHRRWKSKPIK